MFTIKKKIYRLTNKKFNSCDDEIVLKDLYPKTPRELSDEEKNELNKTILYSKQKKSYMNTYQNFISKYVLYQRVKEN